MKRFIGIQLVIFFVSASMLYLYANKIFASEGQSAGEITAAQSHKIWKVVEGLEDSWYTKEPKSVVVTPLDQSKANALRDVG